MKKLRQASVGLVVGLAIGAFSSCAYDPYYTSASYSSYGDGYGYGNSSFSTTTFISTGSSRWGYDPYAGAYYDYSRRAYYDPYLYGYYPVGYRPRYVTGAPHPHGWSRGKSYCPPPSRVRDYKLTNYRDRGSRYQSLGRDWSRNVKTDHNHSSGRGPSDRNHNSYQNQSRDQRPDEGRNRYEPQRKPGGDNRYNSGQRNDSGNARGNSGRGPSPYDQNRSVSSQGNRSKQNAGQQRQQPQQKKAQPQRQAPQRKEAPQQQKRASGTRAERNAAANGI